MSALAGAIASGSMANLQKLWLTGNQIGDAGMSAFAGAIASGSMAKIGILRLDSNEIDDKGINAFADTSASMANLRIMRLDSNEIGDAGMSALAGAIASGSLPALRDVDMIANPGSDAPVRQAIITLQPPTLSL